MQAAAFFGSAVGALFFGDLADRIGRRRVFVLNLVAFVGLALVSAVVTEVWMLFVVRVLIGVAIGADIAASISFLAELSPKGSRGGWTGAMPQITWSSGGDLRCVGRAGLYTLVGSESWRLVFAAGALPAVAGSVVAALVAGLAPMAVGAGASRGSGGGIRAVRRPGAGSLAIGEYDRAAGSGGRDPGARRGWLDPYARLFSGARRTAVVFAILMIGLIPLERDRAERAHSVCPERVWPAPEQGRVDSRPGR